MGAPWSLRIASQALRVNLEEIDLAPSQQGLDHPVQRDCGHHVPHQHANEAEERHESIMRISLNLREVNAKGGKNTIIRGCENEEIGVEYG